MKTILFLTDTHSGTNIAELEGVYDRARVLGWYVVEVEYGVGMRIGDYVKTWRPDGCIATCSAVTSPIAPKLLKTIPTVYIDPDSQTLQSGSHCVVNDPVLLAETAFRELSGLSCVSYAYAGWDKRTPWNENRRTAFERLATESGAAVSAFINEKGSNDRLKRQKKLEKWLTRLPKRCGVFAANDAIAAQVADACHFTGLKIPNDVAVIGVDNIETTCENAIVSLSSIEIDFREAGRMSADLLAQLLENPDMPPETRTFGPERLVRRMSTRDLAITDERISNALERIRREACLGLSAAEIIAGTGLPRRAAERWFRRATGTSILAEINRIRLERAFLLLKKQDFPISLIAHQCGWKTDAFLKRLFKRTTGMTMRDWRNRATAPVNRI